MGDNMHNPTNPPRRTAATGTAQPNRTRAARPAKRRRGPGPAESCSLCGHVLRVGEAAFLWQTKVVCGECYSRRQAAFVAAALAAPHLPSPEDDLRDRRPWWLRAWRAMVRLLCCPLTPRRLMSQRSRRRQQQGAAVDPLFAHLHRLAHRA